MARLPDATALGQAPGFSVSGTTPKLDVSGIGKGQAVAAKAIEGAGATLYGIAEQKMAEQDALLEAQTNADWSIKRDQLFYEKQLDPNYQKAPQAFRDEASKVLMESAQRITNPVKRQLFIEKNRVNLENHTLDLVEKSRKRGNDDTLLKNDERINTLADQALANPDEKFRTQKLQEIRSVIDGEVAARIITPAQARTRQRQFIERYGESFATDFINRDPQKALEHLDKIVPGKEPNIGPRSEGVAPGYTVGKSDVESYIVQAAKARGIDPNVALTVYRHEGSTQWQSTVVKDGKRERSYGPFQLYVDGGLGNKFQSETGLDPRDPSTWRENIDFALDEAKKSGWASWMGARAAGITGRYGLDGKPTQVAALNTGTATDAGRGPVEGVQVAQAQTGTPLDFLRADQIVRLRQRAEQAIKARAADEERAIRLQEKEAKRASDDEENGVLKSMYGDGQSVTARDIVYNDKLSREAKERLIPMISRLEKPEPPSQVSARTAKDLLERMRLPDGDPNKLTNVADIYDAYTKEGLTKADFGFVRGEFEKLRTDSGDTLTKRKHDFINAIKGQITKSNPLMGKIDTTGDEQLYRFDYEAQQKIDQYRKEGKNPHDLFDPSKPDYLGKPEAIAPYQKTLQQSLQERARALSGRPVTTAPASNAAPVLPKIEPRKPGETPAEYLKRTGKL